MSHKVRRDRCLESEPSSPAKIPLPRITHPELLARIMNRPDTHSAAVRGIAPIAGQRGCEGRMFHKRRGKFAQHIPGSPDGGRNYFGQTLPAKFYASREDPASITIPWKLPIPRVSVPWGSKSRNLWIPGTERFPESARLRSSPRGRNKDLNSFFGDARLNARKTGNQAVPVSTREISLGG